MADPERVFGVEVRWLKSQRAQQASRERTRQSQAELIAKIRVQLEKDPVTNTRDMARALGVSRQEVSSAINRMVAEGEVERDGDMMHEGVQGRGRSKVTRYRRKA